MTGFLERALSSAVEHYLDMVGVTGSIPVVPTRKFFRLRFVECCSSDSIYCENNLSRGRTRGFESPLHCPTLDLSVGYTLRISSPTSFTTSVRSCFTASRNSSARWHEHRLNHRLDRLWLKLSELLELDNPVAVDDCDFWRTAGAVATHRLRQALAVSMSIDANGKIDLLLSNIALQASDGLVAVPLEDRVDLHQDKLED